MAAQAVLPPDLTDDVIHYILVSLDVYLNSIILQMLMHGLYTGILGVTLWTIFRSSTKNSSIGRCVMVVAIFALYVLATVLAGKRWSIIHYAFIKEGQNCYTVYTALFGFLPMVYQGILEAGILSYVSTFIADSSLIWRCWIVWNYQWLIVIIPILCVILETVFKGIQIYHDYTYSVNDIEDSTYSGTSAKWTMLYMALLVTTTLWCTIFILYRIIHVARSGHRAGIRTYYGVIEVLVESAVLYSTVLIIDIVFTACNILSGNYVDVLASAIKGIAPTLLVGRVAAGYARPDDSWQDSNSTISSLNFGTGTVSTQDGDILQSAELNEMDNLNPGLERNSASIEEVAQETRSLDIV